MQESYERDDWLAGNTEGELAIDVYQDEHNIYILAPVAGVRASDIDVSITDEVVTIRGERKLTVPASDDKFFAQECYWGTFSRSYVLPIAVESENAKATLKDGLLRLEIPKDARVKTRVIKINDR